MPNASIYTTRMQLDAMRVSMTAHELGTFAYHVSVLMRDTGKFGLSLGDKHLDIVIEPGNLSASTKDAVWDQCQMGGHWVGNRCGAVDAYARFCAGDPNWFRPASNE